MSIYRTAVEKPVTVSLIFLAFAILGLFALTRLPVDNFPDIESNVIMVMSSYPGASAEDVENNLTKVLENSLNGVSDLKHITSSSRENIAVLTLQFEYGTDIEVATNDVRDKLDMVSQTLPDGASLPTIFKFSVDDMPIMIMAATADQSLSALDKLLDDRIATPLARVSGVGTVSVAGAPNREIQVYCDPNKLEAYGLSVAAISSIIATENRNVPSGSIDIGSDTYTLRIKKEFKDPSELNSIIVGSYNGQAVYLRDVARIRDGLEEKSQESYTNGVRGAQIIIQKQAGYNTVNVIRKVKAEMERLQKNLPSDVKITTVVDNSDSIIQTINSLRDTILITFLVVMLVVFLFLGRFKGTLIVVLSIPIALLGSLLYLFATGNTLQIIFVAFMVGIALLFLGQKTGSVAKAIEQINTLVQFLMDVISRIVPFLVFLIIVSFIWSRNYLILSSMWRFFLALVAACVLAAVFYLCYTAARMKTSPVILLKKSLPNYLVATATASSAATFSSNMTACEKGFGIDSSLASFGIPLGMVMHKPVLGVYYALMSFFLARSYGVTCSLAWIDLAVFISAILAIATPPIPGGGAIAYALLLSQLGIPADALPFLLTIDIATDFLVTGFEMLILPLTLIRISHKLGVINTDILRSDGS